MKKILSIVLIFGTMCLFSTSAFATDKQSNAEGSITLLDTTGGGPGVKNIAISAKGCAAYSAAAGAGGYAGAAGQILCVVTGSSAADKDVALYFGVRNSEDSADTEDNNIYQKAAAGTAVTVGQCVTDVGTNISTWQIRGGS